MKIIIIDADMRDIYEKTIGTDDSEKVLEAMQDAVGGLIERAGELENGDDVYVNEEGLINGTVNCFQMPGVGQGAFAGSAIVVGHDGDGNTVEAKSTKGEIRKKVNFLNLYELKLKIAKGELKCE
jgi:hypothetical protein